MGGGPDGKPAAFKFLDIEIGTVTRASAAFKIITFRAALSKVDCFPGSAIKFRAIGQQVV